MVQTTPEKRVDMVALSWILAGRLKRKAEEARDRSVQQQRRLEEQFMLEDLLATLRTFAERTDGQFPSTLVSGEMIDAMVEAWEQANPGKPLFKGDTIEYADRTLNRAVQNLLGSFSFVRRLEKQGVAYTYAGKGVKLGDKDRPVFWYKPKGSPTFTVVYGDLATREANMAPTTP
jgi:hypothetical protein